MRLQPNIFLSLQSNIKNILLKQNVASNSNVQKIQFFIKYGFFFAYRYSSRRAKTMESLTSLYAEEDVVKNLEESARLQRAFANYFDLVVVDESHDQTFREVMDAWMALSVMDQWVPSTWVYS